jgi:hypothetical protein
VVCALRHGAFQIAVYTYHDNVECPIDGEKMFADKTTALSLMTRAKQLGLGDEVMQFVDSCVTDDNLEGTDTTWVDWKKALIGLETIVSAAAKPATGIIVEEE